MKVKSKIAEIFVLLNW